MRPNTECRSSDLRRVTSTLLLLFLSSAADLSAQTGRMQWSEPKIPTRFARVLEAGGQLNFVDQRIDWVAYYPWPSFSTEDGGPTMSLGYVLEDGQRIAYVAIQGHGDREVANSLLEVAQRMPQGRTVRQTAFPRPDATFLLIGFVFVVVVAFVVFNSASSEERRQAMDDNRFTDSCSPTVLRPGGRTVRSYHDRPDAPNSREGTGSDVADMLGDLEAVDQAGILTRGVTKRWIVRNVDQRTEVVEAYQRYFRQVNHAMTARRDIEQTKREIEDFELNQSLRRKHLEIESAELDARMAEIEVQRLEAERAKERLRSDHRNNGSVRREDYDL